ncbi:interleukin-31 receptor subunit alpha-like isoform X2 [Hemiscyllium ocellatum]|uniref:interleukin-31 receptor subunit alpha-like isoform X2 n=1 Tax=Hemiscyllium ocellatum TaxID=170820 RepID=UPI002966D6B5|nr:interleukin-31 receptor subunit alpha-like isoform X2 [Hemiscyllium ocellatum]
MKPVHLLLHLLASSLGTSSEKCESEQVTEFPDGPHNLQCYYIKEIENGLKCTWNHGKHHTNTTTYTLKIYRIGKTSSLNTKFTAITGTFYVIERKYFYISENTTISITTVEQRSKMYQNTTSITLIPKDSEKPATPSDIKYTKHEGQLKLTWSTSKELEYELAYRKAGTCNWLSVHFQPSGTLQGLERLAAYEFRMRCKIKLWSSWTKIYHVPPELIDKPQVYMPVTELMQEPGKRRFTIRWESAATANSTIVQGYNITIERIPTNQSYDIQSFETFSKECVFILSQACFKFRVLAYNSASFSPANEIILPSFNQMSLNNRINATPQGNNSILISWNSDVNRQTRVYIIDWGPVIGNKAHIQWSKRIKKNRLNFTLKDTFKPKQRYRIMLHSKTKKIPMNNTEKTIGVVDVYTLEGTPRIGPSNITVTNISKTSAMIRWNPIPEDECQGFLQGYKIFYCVIKSAVGNTYSPISVNSSTTFYMLTGLLRKTLYTVQISGYTKAGEGIRSKAVSFDTKEYNDGEIKAIAVGISITIIIFVFLVTWRCLFLFRRIKEIFWPSIPNPGNSYVIRIIGKDSLLPQLENELLSLKTNPPLMEDLESLHIIEEVTNTSIDCQLQENEEDSVTDQDSNSNLSNKPPFIQVTDYTTMENFRQIIAGTNTAIQPSRCETEFNNQQNGCLIQSYMKQQVHQTSIQTPGPIGIACD